VRAQESAATDNEDAAQWLLGLRGNGSHCVCGWGSGLKGSSREVEIWGLKSSRITVPLSEPTPVLGKLCAQVDSCSQILFSITLQLSLGRS
jgi:hypothetical protein